MIKWRMLTLVFPYHLLALEFQILQNMYIYKQIQVIRPWIQNSAQQLRSGLTVNRLLNIYEHI